MPTQSGAPTSISVNPDEILGLFLQKRHDEVSEKFIAVLSYFRDNLFLSLNPQEQYFIDQFVKLFLYVISEPAFVIADRFVSAFFSFNHLISNLVAMSSTKNTDAYIAIMQHQPENLVRLLTIYSARNQMKIDRKVILNANLPRACEWFAYYACSYYGALVSQTAWENLREHFSFVDPRLRIGHYIQETYFGATYAGGGRDKIMKPIVNQTVRERMADTKLTRKPPDPRKFALISGYWKPSTSVYRILASLVRSLKPDFHMTFVQIGEGPAPDPDLWDDVRKITANNGSIDLSAIADADFQVAYFPDVGMSDISIIMANLRIAPIQMVGPGHPVSTFGAQIDYFMSGAEIEPPDHPEQNYSERLVIMPGTGMSHTRPMYKVQRLKKDNPVLIVNLPAWCQKINYPFVQTLRKIQQAARNKFKIRLFSGNSSGRANDYLPFYREISSQLGAGNIEVLPSLPYGVYMAEMEHGDLALDAFHFGGGNTVSDNLFIGVPMLCWEGDQWYNRIGPATLRRANLPELIVTNESQYIEQAVRLIDDTEYRVGLRQKLQGLNLDELLYNQKDGRHFNTAVHYLIDNHEQLKADNDRSPVRIPNQ